MPNFPNTFESRKQSSIGDFSICMTVPLRFDPNLIALAHLNKIL